MIYSQEVENMCPVAQGVHHGCAPIPEEAKWVQAKEVKDISGFTKVTSLGLDRKLYQETTTAVFPCQTHQLYNKSLCNLLWTAKHGATGVDADDNRTFLRSGFGPVLFRLHGFSLTERR